MPSITEDNLIHLSISIILSVISIDHFMHQILLILLASINKYLNLNDLQKNYGKIIFTCHQRFETTFLPNDDLFIHTTSEELQRDQFHMSAFLLFTPTNK